MYHFTYMRSKAQNSLNVLKAVEKLQKNELTAEELLDDEELTNDLKNQSFSQLSPYLNDDIIKKLIIYIIKENEDDAKLGYKFPFNSAEILSFENSHITDLFFFIPGKTEDDHYEELDDNHIHKNSGDSSELQSNHEINVVEKLNDKFENIDLLFSFVNTENKLNYVLCGYFQKVFMSLANSRNGQVKNYLFLVNEIYFR